MAQYRDPHDELDRLRQGEHDGALPPLRFFFGHHAPAGHDVGPFVLSQWWPAPFEVGGICYHHAEGYLMAEKARTFGDETALGRILAATRPEVAKRIGRGVSGYDDHRWAELRYAAAVRGNLAKFSQHPELGRYLLSTAPAVLVEASPFDPIWGIGLRAIGPDARHPSRWRGTNLLGFALTEVRALLATTPQSPS